MVKSTLTALTTVFIGSLLAQDLKESVTLSSKVNLPFVEESSENAPVAPAVNPMPTDAEVEAALFNRAARELDPKRKLELIDEFLKAYPNSTNMLAARYVRFLAYRESGDGKSALTSGEVILLEDQTREDVLLYVAARYFNERRELGKVIEYCRNVIDLLTPKAAPQNIDEALWVKQKDTALFESQGMIASAHFLQNDWISAEKSLKMALASAKTGEHNIGAVLNLLAWTNYKLKRIPEAVRLYDQCAGSATHGNACKQTAAYIRNEYSLR